VVEARRAWRVGLLGAALAVALAALAALQARPGQGLTALPLYDFVQYWAAAQLTAAGEGPYDLVRMGELERSAGRTDEPILMWAPPWALGLVLPLALFDCRTAHVLWLLFHLAVVVGCADALWRHYGGPERLRGLAWLVALTFTPTGLALLAGQISPLLLLGATGFLVCVRRRLDGLAGAAAVLLAVKPHLAYLFWPALACWALSARRWRVLGGGALAGASLTGLVMACSPSVWVGYWHTFTISPPAQYRSPTLGTLLRLLAGDGPFGLQFVALAPGLAWLAWHGWRRHSRWDWDEQLPPLLLASLLTAAYGAWPFDLVLLLLPVLRVAAALPRAGRGRALFLAGAGHIIINGLALGLVAHEAEYLWFIWMSPALLLAYLVCQPPAQETGPQPGPSAPHVAVPR
jgi:hypothetical protein